MPLITRDETTGHRRSVIRYPDGTPPRPAGCRWCGVAEDVHDVRWSDAASFHVWATPTAAQVKARILAHATHATHGTPQHAAPTAPQTLLGASIAAFQAANQHIRDGCTTCTPAARLPEMCPDGQRLTLTAVNSLATEPITH
ncbi:hypothetical protein ACFRQM_09540 [Streptomyces sp. NPDC056831]|uniref:hypothetical protein n=1 Tax=Streptomyces sp. NPDC056831 TaxID=3345954 RepID=UPI0036A0F63C